MNPLKLQLLAQGLKFRNLIAHEYASEKMQDIYATVATLTPVLLTVVPKVAAYATALQARYAPDL